MVPCIFKNIIIVFHSLADIIHRRHRTHRAYHLQIILEFFNTLRHPVFPIKFKILADFLKGNPRTAEKLPADITVWPVDNLQKILPLAAAKGNPDIGQDIPCNPMIINIGNFFFHYKWNVVSYHLFCQRLRLGIRPVKHRHF